MNFNVKPGSLVTDLNERWIPKKVSWWKKKYTLNNWEINDQVNFYEDKTIWIKKWNEFFNKNLKNLHQYVNDT